MKVYLILNTEKTPVFSIIKKISVFSGKKAGFLMSALLMFSAFLSQAQTYQRPGDSSLIESWNNLEEVRKYREDWRGQVPKTHEQLISSYKGKLTGVNNNVSQTHSEWLSDLTENFVSVMESTDNSQSDEVIIEAQKGVQEVLNEYMKGQLLVGNDYLIKGLRVRFPNTGDPEDPDQLTLLSLAHKEFNKGLNAVVEVLRKNPEVLRSRGDVNPRFPFYVENSVPENGGQGEVVENEYWHFTDLVERNMIASNSKAKRMFYFGNVDDVDNYPYGNFPSQEDLDFNKDRIKNSGGRVEAKQQAAKTAHDAWLHTIVLASVQSTDDFQMNNGYKLKRQILDAQRLYDDINSGFNPLKLQGDFVPYQPVENFLNLARARINDAIIAENEAADSSRSYDTDNTALLQTLQSQQLTYLNRISSLTGLSTDGYNLSNPVDEKRLRFDAEQSTRNGRGEMGLQQLVINNAALSAKQIQTSIDNTNQRIKNTQEKTREYTKITNSYGRRISALVFSEAIANSLRVGIQFDNGTPKPSFSWNPMEHVLGEINKRKILAQLSNQIAVNRNESDYVIKNYLLEMTTLSISLEQAVEQIKIEEAKLEELKAELTRLIDNYKNDRQNLAESYFNNPAYRLERDQYQDAAEKSFETAMTESYYAAKALEYQWSEKFNNPVLRLDGGLPESLSVSFDPFVRAESVFNAKFSNTRIPSLDDFLEALQAWDVKMRQLRSPNAQSSRVILSMKDDIMNYVGEEDYVNNLFKTMIEENRVQGQGKKKDLEFRFTLHNADESLFPDLPNLKIESIGVNLVSDSARSIRETYDTNPVLVDLIMLDRATVRTFFADYPNDDDTLNFKLQEGRTVDDSPFYATVSASVDNFAYPSAVPNVQLSNHSPAVSQWVFRIKMNRKANRDLLLEHLQDIEITFNYSYGKPRNIAFPN